MQIYLDNEKNTVTMVQSVASASTMISSVAIEAKDFVVSKFPKNFFKHIYVDTSQTITQINYNSRYSKTANKIPYPSLAVTPAMSLDDPIGGMERNMHLSSPNLYIRRDIDRTQNRLIMDPDNQFAVYYSSDYVTTNFDFKIITNTYVSNVDIAYYLKSRFQPGFFQYLNNRFIQTEIPKSLIMVIADIFGYDLSDNDDMDKLRLYLMGTGKTENMIQKKLNPATGKQCFFLEKDENFLVLFTDLDCPPSIIKDNQVEGEYTINFRLQISCHMPNAFILRISKDRLREIDSGIIDKIDNGISDDLESGIVSQPIISANLLSKKDTIYFYDRNDNQQIGHLVYAETFMNDVNNAIDKIYILHDYNTKQKSEFSNILDYAIQNNFDLSSLYTIKVFSREGELAAGDFMIDYPEMSVTLLNEKYAESDIAVSLYVNRLAYELLKKGVNGDDFYKSNILTRIHAKTIETDDVTGEETEKPIHLVVHALQKDSSFNEEKSPLRINTPYGIGYIGLKDDVDSGKNLYKICTKIDNNGNPVIKVLETEEM